jgi:hypothetical protein
VFASQSADGKLLPYRGGNCTRWGCDRSTKPCATSLVGPVGYTIERFQNSELFVGMTRASQNSKGGAVRVLVLNADGCFREIGETYVTGQEREIVPPHDRVQVTILSSGVPSPSRRRAEP